MINAVDNEMLALEARTAQLEQTIVLVGQIKEIIKSLKELMQKTN